MESIRFVVERITYQNPENGYSVLKVNMKDYRDLVTVVGVFGDLFVGAVLLCEGYWHEDRKYGRQFKAVKWEEVLPATAYGIEKYLGSGMIRGIGPKYAARIVQQFGTDTIDIIDRQSSKLMATTASESLGRIPSVWRMISGASASRLPTRWRKRWVGKRTILFAAEAVCSTRLISCRRTAMSMPPGSS